jgi:Polyketide cyclase / dehydrase and lipid transport
MRCRTAVDRRVGNDDDGEDGAQCIVTTRTRARIKLVRVKIRGTVNRPIDEVFAYIVSAETIPEWQYGTVRAWFTPTASLAIGTTLHLMTSTRGSRLLRRTREGSLTVTDYQSNALMELTTDYGPFRFRTRYLLEPAEEGTSLRCEFEGRATEWAARLLLPLVTRKLARLPARNIRALKAKLESRSESAVGA